MSRSAHSTYERRVETLKRRRDFLDQRIADYQGKDASRDKAETSALHWALGVIEANYISAIELIVQEYAEKEAVTSKQTPNKPSEDSK